jgi:outer membrane protein assembly factor BamB
MNTRAGLLALLLLCACQREQWELPAALGTPQRSSNYSAAAELPPSIPLLLPLDAADTSGCVVPPLVLSSRRWIMATSGGSLLSVSPTRVDWLFRLPGGATATSLAADSSRVYALATDGMLYALSHEGKLLWSTAAFAPLDSGAAYAHLLPFSDGVLAASLAGELLCFSGDGRLRWRSNRAAPIGRLPAAFADAVALSSGPGVPGETDTLVLLDASTGQQRWARALPLTAISSGPVVGDRFLAVAGIRYNPESSPAAVLHAFSPTGELLWSQLLPAPARFLATADSSLYVGIGSTGVGNPISGVLCFSRQGKLLWKLYLQAELTAPPIVFRQALLCLARQGGALGAYVLSREDGSLREVLSLSEAPPLVLVPAVTPDGEMLLGWSHRLGLLRLSYHPWKWLLP